MKKFVLLLAFLASSAGSAVFYGGTAPTTVPRSVAAGPFSFLAADVVLAKTDTAYSQAFDMLQIPLLVVDSLGIKARVDTTIGTVIASCYDIADSAAIVDTVKVTVTMQQQLYAADGVSPYVAKGAVWDSVGAITFDAASDANAIVQGTLRPTLKTADHRFARFRLINFKNNAKDIPRCRLYWQRRAYTR